MKVNVYMLSSLLLVFLFSACGGSKKVAHKKHRVYHKPNSSRVLSKSERDLERNTPVIDPGKDDYQKQKNENFSSNTERYIYAYHDIAKQEMKTYGIPASITLAQGILESGAGVGKLTRRSNNHFGIKCNGWQGEKVYHDDDRAQECFRKYTNPKYSFRDHSLFLKNRSRYAALFRLNADDYKGWARGLKSAGYATDPRYPKKLIALIDRYNLHRYDKEVINGEGVQEPQNQDNKRVAKATYVVKKGDTLYSISRQFDLTVEQLKRLNGLNGNTISIGQKLFINSN